MEDFVKNTAETHDDFPKLNQALHALLDVAGKVNEAVTEAENNQKMLNIAKKFEGYKEQNLITPGRTFVMEGDLHKVCRKDAKKGVCNSK
ncbi:rho guanine nucleotide exchange factor [Patescibacteria group bacterium]|nr:rho guanine nucleotide exchange factor [Patescibacteria group bacterium]